MTPFGIAVCIVVVLVGVGCFFTGYSMGIQWVLSNTVIELEENDDESGSDQADG